MSASGDRPEIPDHVVVVDLADLGVPDGFEFDCVLSSEDRQLTILFYPADDDEGWTRLHEVGEWLSCPILTGACASA